MKSKYSFNKQLSKGENEEKNLDAHFSEHYHIFDVPIELQKNGIDRIFVRKNDFLTYKIEYKSDFKTHITGNVFIETCSVFSNYECKVKGWTYTSKADFLIYFVVEEKIAYVIRMETIREHIDAWKSKYSQRSSPNYGYETIGILVPPNEFKSKTEAIIRINKY